ncbi:MAG: glycosyltransferase family 2 protein, partial [Candidatus Levyibacteriota bacterium]
MTKKVSAIVPIFNEQKTLEAVLTTLVSSSYISEVIVVNDCSTDSSLAKLQKIKGITLINLSKNHGKAYAIAKGIEKASSEI